MHLSKSVVIRWIEDLSEMGDCLEERQGKPCYPCWKRLSDLVIIIANALEDDLL